MPENLDGSSWSPFESLFDALMNRELSTAQDLERWLLDRSELDSAASEAAANLYIRMTCHTDDPDAQQAYRNYLEQVAPKLRVAGFELDKKLAASPWTKSLDRSRYEVLLRDTTVDVETFREENVPLQTEDGKLDQDYSAIRGAISVSFDGAERTLPQMQRYLEETDRVVREAAWRAMADRQLKDRDQIDAIFDQQIALRDRMGRNAGYQNYRDYAFPTKHRFDYGPKECEDFHRSIEECCMPLVRELNRERAKALGIERLGPWDMAVDPFGRPPLRPFETAAGLVEGCAKIFVSMDDELSAMFDRLRSGDCLDLESRKGKAPGGYQYQRDRCRRPFIFMNAAGMQRDLVVMLHEAGHAFHSLLSNHEPLLHYRHTTAEFAEVASMSMELLSHPYWSVFYDEPSHARARRSHFEGILRILPWIATIDAFQHWLYTHPSHSRAERTAFWRQLIDRFGFPELWEGLEEHRDVRWQAQLHLFGHPFYYVEYGIAQLGALQLWLQSKQDAKRALANYKRALSLGGSRPLPELFGAAELAFDFKMGTVARLVEEVKSELEKLPL
ncbi:MAG: M3 family oligoendopeptidase [Planctomycetota bacterium]